MTETQIVVAFYVTVCVISWFLGVATMGDMATKMRHGEDGTFMLFLLGVIFPPWCALVTYCMAEQEMKRGLRK